MAALTPVPVPTHGRQAVTEKEQEGAWRAAFRIQDAAVLRTREGERRERKRCFTSACSGVSRELPLFILWAAGKKELPGLFDRKTKKLA